MADEDKKNHKSNLKNVQDQKESFGQIGSGNQLFKGTLILTLAGTVVKIIGSLNWIFLSRILGGEGIGLYLMAYPLYFMALSISSAGIPVAISIITAEQVALRNYEGANRVFNLSFVVLLISGLVLSTVLYLGSSWLIEYRIIRDPRAYYSIIALSPAIFLVTLLSSFRGYLQGWQMMTPTAVSQIVEQLFRVATMLILANLLMPRGLQFAAGGASLGASLGAVAALLVLVYYYLGLKRKINYSKIGIKDKTVLKESNIKIIKNIIKLALPISLSSILLPLVANLDLIVVPLRLEAAGFSVEQATTQFGYLTGMAVPLLNLATILTAALATSIVPAISQAHSIGKKQDVYYRTSGAMRLSNIATIPFSVMLWVLAEPVVTVIYNSPGAASVTKVVAASVFFLGIQQVTTGVLQGLGKTIIPVIIMGVAAICKVALNWMLTAIPSFGIEGAAWATFIDTCLATVLNLYYVYRYTGFVLNLEDLLKNIISATVMGGVMHFSYQLLVAVIGNNLLTLAINFFIGGLTYSLIMLISGGINRRDIERIPFIGQKFRKN